MSEVAASTPQRSGRRFEVGKLDDFPVGAFRIVTAGSHEVGVIRLASGAVHAVLNRCPHRGAPICKGIVSGTWPPSEVGELAYERDGEVLSCPWHGFEFALDTGLELYQKRPMRLRKFKLDVEAGTVVITV